MKKTICVLMAAFMLMLLAACGSAKLPEGVTEDDVTTAAKNTVDYLNAKDYDSLVATMDDEMQEALPSDKLAEAWEPFYGTLGEFDSITKTTVGAQKGYAVAVVSAKYKNKTATLTLSYDSEMKLAGMFFK